MSCRNQLEIFTEYTEGIYLP